MGTEVPNQSYGTDVLNTDCATNTVLAGIYTVHRAKFYRAAVPGAYYSLPAEHPPRQTPAHRFLLSRYSPSGMGTRSRKRAFAAHTSMNVPSVGCVGSYRLLYILFSFLRTHGTRFKRDSTRQQRCILRTVDIGIHSLPNTCLGWYSGARNRFGYDSIWKI